MESHERIRMSVIKVPLNGFLIHIFRNRIIDIEQGYYILADTSSDKITQRTIDIYLAGYRNASSGQTAVDITWYKTELCLKCRPAFACDGHVLAVDL